MRRRIYIGMLWGIWVGIVVVLTVRGAGYYRLPLIDRPLAPEHAALNPGGTVGHGLGIAGSMLIITGVAMYAVRKRMRRLMGWGNLRDWLAFHIFLCVTGATLVTFHTAFKFGGLVAVCYWCMMGVVLSGVLGRYVYVRIPRDIRGNEVAAATLHRDYEAIAQQLQQTYALPEDTLQEIDRMFGFDASGAAVMEARSIFRMVIEDGLRLWRRGRVRRLLVRRGKIPMESVRDVMRLVQQRAGLVRSIHFYITARRVLHYWHVIHLPFTMVMFLIMFIHVATAIVFGYRWIF